MNTLLRGHMIRVYIVHARRPSPVARSKHLVHLRLTTQDTSHDQKFVVEEAS